MQARQGPPSRRRYSRSGRPGSLRPDHERPHAPHPHPVPVRLHVALHRHLEPVQPGRGGSVHILRTQLHPHTAHPRGVLVEQRAVDRRHTAFLGSANLTDRALSDNIELGVVLRDPQLVEPLVDHFHWMLAPENNVMRLA